MYNNPMIKQKKRRNKKYTGADAATQRPKVIRITATNRSKLSQWIFDRKKFLRAIGVVILAVISLALIISVIISLFR